MRSPVNQESRKFINPENSISNTNSLIAEIGKVKSIEKEIPLSNPNITIAFTNK